MAPACPAPGLGSAWSGCPVEGRGEGNNVMQGQWDSLLRPYCYELKTVCCDSSSDESKRHKVGLTS